MSKLNVIIKSSPDHDADKLVTDDGAFGFDITPLLPNEFGAVGDWLGVGLGVEDGFVVFFRKCNYCHDSRSI